MSAVATVSYQAMDKFVAERLSDHRAKTPEGYLLCLGVPIARTGVQTYRAEEIDRDGQLGLRGLVDVYRPKEEVLSPGTVSSFEGKSVVSPHPPQFLNPDNDAAYSKGHGQNIRAGSEKLPDGEWPILADLLIKDATLIQQIEDNQRFEISCGYTYDLEPMGSSSGSENVRFAQCNIRGNHIAIVASGRAGSSVKVLDAKPEEGVETMAEAAVDKPGIFAELGSFLKAAGLRLVASDADPGAVERNRKVDEKSNAKYERTEDAGHPDADKTEKEEKMKTADADEKMEKEEKGAEKPDKKDEKGSDKKGKDAMDARLDRIVDALETLVARDAKSKDDDEDEEEMKKKEAKDAEKEKEKEEKESEDSDLIPVPSLHGDEIPQNPIPGADEALEHLRVLKPLIANSGNQQAIDGYNDALRAIKGKRRGSDAYGDMARPKKGDDVRSAEARAGVHEGRDSRSESLSFEEGARKYHRKNAQEVAAVVAQK